MSYSMRRLTSQPRYSTHSDLFTLMEEEPPPVPPKDAAYMTPQMELDRPPPAPASGSKRKRAHDDALYKLTGEDPDASDLDAHTPKRGRSMLRQSDASASEDATPVQHRNVRRKKGLSNLSNLNLRHAAEQQAFKDLQARESRFQEGSLTDKPSEKPPSVYTRMMRTESGNVSHVDELMEDYHEDIPTPRVSTERVVDHGRVETPAAMSADHGRKDEGNGYFRFGRQFAANFHPVTLWNRIWNDTKDELTRKNIEEAERRARQKAEAEARYAQLKQAGQLGLQPVDKLAGGPRGSVDSTETPRDSGVEIEGLHRPSAHPRTGSAASGLLPPYHDTISRSGSEVPETASKQNKGLKNRLHFKKPSMTNIKTDLKRVGSDLNLTKTLRNRDSSASLSPVKPDFSTSTLKRSESRFDLKKQQKLSKRVSDLESKLDQARRELDTALVEASPMPKLSGKFERFTPSSTMKRPRFIPGKLPSLPSERVLMAEQRAELTDASRNEAGEDEPKKGLDHTGEHLEDNQVMDDSIVKGSRANINNNYPTRASSLFNLQDENVANLSTSNNDQATSNLKSTEQQQLTTEATENMDPNSITTLTGNGDAEAPKPADYESLDAKLKALEKNAKLARAPNKSKKRKSIPANDDKVFKPATESDDDAEWEEANQTPRKKRKSAGSKDDSSPPSKRPSTRPQNSPQGKKGKRPAANSDVLSSSPVSKKKGDKQAVAEEQAGAGAAETQEDEFSANEADSQPVRTSVDSQAQPLDVVYEEEEETIKVPLNDEPSKPTAKATPARYGRTTLRSRSNSPHKRGNSLQPGPEEQMMVRAGEAAKMNPARRSVSPLPPTIDYTETTTVVSETKTVTVVPGADGVRNLPRGANGSFESLMELDEEEEEGGRSFEWPEDVF
ncbi:hypothetical protein LTR37_004265 [Vermiconidia calcicola]|uniref:Uncharacterized protein n=1 Tax=Vermiconidia calcicola TaxID=1690605 RepID=A0ACC3NN81_9PEZI|nr:hypothetical protein LTR37_004265 [Vermiconidia calcicola]